MIRVLDATPTEDYCVRVRFSNGEVRHIDLRPFLRGAIFEPVQERSEFLKLEVDPQLGTIVWPNGADICPDVLYRERAVVE
ncbi:MAG: DUF2442 domain-containing protein [Planctomycetota bacterium]